MKYFVNSTRFLHFRRRRLQLLLEQLIVGLTWFIILTGCLVFWWLLLSAGYELLVVPYL